MGTSNITSDVAMSGNLTVTGTTTLTGAHSHTGNFDVNTNKFTVNATSGNTAILGDLALNTDKFTVTAASGNTLVAGVLAVTGNVDIATNKFNVAAASGDTLIAGTLGVTGAVTLTAGLVRTSQQYIIPALASKVGGAAGWVVAAADNLAVATVPQSVTAGILIIPISGLKVGWTLTAVSLIGQCDSAGNTITVDMDIRKMTAATAGATDASLSTMTQLSVTADTAMSAANAAKTLTTPDVVAATETFYAKITVTTGATCDVELQGLLITVTEA